MAIEKRRGCGDTLEYLQSLVKLSKCPACGTTGNFSKIDLYPHEGGWEVKGYDKRQWLSVTCLSCGNGYDWSLWKLGVLGCVEHPWPEVGVLDA